MTLHIRVHCKDYMVGLGQVQVCFRSVKIQEPCFDDWSRFRGARCKGGRLQPTRQPEGRVNRRWPAIEVQFQVLVLQLWRCLRQPALGAADQLLEDCMRLGLSTAQVLIIWLTLQLQEWGDAGAAHIEKWWFNAAEILQRITYRSIAPLEVGGDRRPGWRLPRMEVRHAGVRRY